MNDFTAQALAQSDPTAHGNLPVIAGEPKQNAPLFVIGPGKGLGVSALIPDAAGMLPLEGEAGHVSFARRSEAAFPGMVRQESELTRLHQRQSRQCLDP